MKIQRTITYYEKIGEEFLGEQIIEANIDTLKKIIIPYENDPEVYMVYPLTFEHKKIVKQIFGIELDIENYDYFLECSQA